MKSQYDDLVKPGLPRGGTVAVRRTQGYMPYARSEARARRYFSRTQMTGAGAKGCGWALSFEGGGSPDALLADGTWPWRALDKESDRTAHTHLSSKQEGWHSFGGYNLTRPWTQGDHEKDRNSESLARLLEVHMASGLEGRTLRSGGVQDGIMGYKREYLA